MAQLDPNSEEFQALAGAVEFTSTALGEFENGVVATVEKSKSMKAELRALQQEKARLAAESTAAESAAAGASSASAASE